MDKVTSSNKPSENYPLMPHTEPSKWINPTLIINKPADNITHKHGEPYTQPALKIASNP